MIRTVIVDDEPLACERIRMLLGEQSDVEIVAECRNGADAVRTIQKLTPDLAFLDVQMPELDGFQVLERLHPSHLPAVIFVTAYDQYAIKAFEVCALDYLLKPFDRDRFAKALARARSELAHRENGSANERLIALLSDLRGTRQTLDRIVVRSGGRVFFLRAEEIDWIEAAGNYVRLHVGREEHLYRETMAGIEKRLDAKRFARIHRSTIVNLDRIQELQPWFRGDYIVLLRDGRKLTLGKAYRGRVLGGPE